jgi:hypothetical protein
MDFLIGSKIGISRHSSLVLSLKMVICQIYLLPQNRINSDFWRLEQSARPFFKGGNKNRTGEAQLTPCIGFCNEPLLVGKHCALATMYNCDIISLPKKAEVKASFYG